MASDGSVRTDAENDISIRVVSSLDDLMRVFAIRTAVYMIGQDCPYDEEFDGNDLAGLHILALRGNEPAGTLRLRFFADFAKLERVALRRGFRTGGLARRMIQFGFDLCARKGYRKVYGQAQVRLLRFWRTVGFREMPDRPHFVFSDHEYAEILCELPPHPNALTLDSDPLQLIRPEGAWDEPSILDRSAYRPPTNPSERP